MSLVPDFSKIVSLLKSKKIRERNEGLQLFQILVQSKFKLGHRAINSLTDASFDLLRTEADWYIDSPTPSIESRLASCSHSLRKLIERGTLSGDANIHSKTYSRIIAEVIGLIYRDSDERIEIIPQMSMNLAKILSACLKQDVKFFLNSDDWTFISSFLHKSTIALLRDPTLLASNEKLLEELYVCLDSLVGTDQHLSLTYVWLTKRPQYLEILDVICCMFKYSKKESVFSLISLKIMNKLLIVLSTEDVKTCQKLVRLGICELVSLHSTRNEQLMAQILVFINLCGPFINLTKLPKVINDNYFITNEVIDVDADDEDEYYSYNDQEMFKSMLSKLIHSLIESCQSPSYHLNPQHISYSFTKSGRNLSWFKLNGIYLHAIRAKSSDTGGDPVPWLLRLGIVKLLAPYLELRGITDEERPSKRQKFDSVGDFLRESVTISDLFDKLLNSTNRNIQRSGLQLLSFYLESTVPSESHAYELKLYGNQLLKGILSSFHNNSDYWSLLACKAILTSASFKFQTDILNQTFKTVFKFLEHEEYYEPACMTIISLTKLDYFRITDKSIITQLDNFIELAPYHGPPTISSSVFLMWYHLYKLYRDLNNSNQFKSKVQGWLLKQVAPEILGPRMPLDHFVCWLNGSKVKITDSIDVYDGYFMDVYQFHSKFQSLSSFLLLQGNDVADKDDRRITYSPESFPTNDFESEFIELFFSSKLVDSLLNHYTYRAEFPLLFLRICEALGETQYSTTCKERTKKLLRKLEWSESVSGGSMYFMKSFTNGLYHFNNEEFSATIEECQPIEDHYTRALKAYKNTNKEEQKIEWNENDDFDGDSVRDSDQHPDIHQPGTALIILKYWVSLSVIRGDAIDKQIEDVLGFIEPLGRTDTLECTNYLIEEILKIKSKPSLHYWTGNIYYTQPEIRDRLLRLANNIAFGDASDMKDSYLACSFRLLRMLLECWQSSESDFRDRYGSVIEFLVTNFGNKFVLEASIREYLLLIMEILTTINCEGGAVLGSLKTNLMEHLGYYFSISSNNVKVTVRFHVRRLITSLESRDMVDKYIFFFEKFSSPQESFEIIPTFCLFFQTISKISETLLVTGMYNLLEWSVLPYAVPYASMTLEVISDRMDMKNVKLVFKLFKLPLLKFWCMLQKDVTLFPIQIFLYKDIDEFLLDNYIELVAFAYSTRQEMSLESLTMFSKISTLLGNGYLEDCLPLIIPLAFTSDGIRNGIFERLISTGGIKEVKLKELLVSKLVFIVDEIISISDCSNGYELAKVSEELGCGKDLEHLMTKGVVNLHVPSNFSISISSTTTLISELINSYGRGQKNFWSVESIYYLSHSVLSKLALASNYDTELLCLARFKLIVIFAFRNFKSPQLFELVVKILSLHISKVCLHDDISRILTFLYEIGEYDSPPSTVVTMPWVLRITSELVPRYISMNKELIDWIEAQTAKIPPKYPLRSFMDCVNNLIWGNNKMETLLGSQFETLIKSNMKLLDLNEGRDIVHLMSVLSDYGGSDGCYLETRDSPIEEVVEFLFELDDSSLSQPFNLWRAGYISDYYTSTGKVVSCLVDKEYEDSLNSFSVATPEDSNVSLDPIFGEMIHNYLNDKDDEVSQCVESIIGVILYSYKSNPQSLNVFNNLTNILGKFEGIMLPMDLTQCVLLNNRSCDNSSSVLHNETLSTIINGFEWNIGEHKFEKWSCFLFVSLVNEICRNTSIAPLLSIFISKVPSFAAKTFPYLTCYYITVNGNVGITNISQMLNKYLNLSAVRKVDEASRLFFRLILMLRSGSKIGIKSFGKVLDSIDLEKAAKLAREIHMPKAALMLLEEYYSNQKHAKDWTKSIPFLSTVYKSIENGDLEYGLPVEPTLDYALSVMDGTSSWKKVMYDSALLDSSLSVSGLQTDLQLYSLLGQEKDEWNISAMTAPYNPTRIMGPLIKAGMNGISKIISESYSSKSFNPTDGSIEDSDVNYGWAWKLNQWDNPYPQKLVSQNAIIYNALKSVHDNPQDRIQMCNDALLSLFNSRLNLVSSKQRTDDISNRTQMDLNGWFRTLSCIRNIEQVLRMDQWSEGDIAKYTNKIDWLDTADLADSEPLILVRKAAFEILAHNPDKSKSKNYLACMVYELSRYSKLCRTNRESQKSINSSLLMDKLSSMLLPESDPIGIYSKRAAKFEMAASLWDQGESKIPVVMLKSMTSVVDHKQQQNLAPFKHLDIPNELVYSYLVKWSSESRQESSKMIMDTYLTQASGKTVANPNQQALIYSMLAKFCVDQLKSPSLTTTLDDIEEIVISRRKDMLELARIYEKRESTVEEKKQATRYGNKLRTQLKADMAERDSLRKNKDKCCELAVEFYLLSIIVSDEFDHENIDKFCALWLEFSEKDSLNMKLGKSLNDLPSYKLIPWANQLISRLSNETSIFQQLLQKTLLQVCNNHPYHTLYNVKSLRLYGTHNKKNDSGIDSRCKAANGLWINLISKCRQAFVELAIVPIDAFSDHCVSLASLKVSKSKRYFMLESVPIVKQWLVGVPRLPPPTKELPVAVDCDYRNSPYMVSVDPKVNISSSGLSLPKIAKFVLSNGELHSVLLKHGSDDLRQDAIMEQVFEQVNKLFQKKKDTSSRKLRIRTYKVVPLGPESGILEFVANSKALIDVIKPYHTKRDKMKLHTARDAMKNAQPSEKSERLKVYNEVCESIQPILRHYFFDNFINPDDWYESRLVYSRGIATTSMVGYMLGLGDRHNNNILLDEFSGEPIHIDLGVAFDQGKLLPIPETVPFRLTRDIVDGFGITGVEGVFKIACEQSFRVLRDEVEHIIGILDVLRWDPLYLWTLSPLKLKHLQVDEEEEDGNDQMKNKKPTPEREGSEAGRSVIGVKNKLTGSLSVEATVRELIQDAVDPQNLSVIYCGWCPFY